MGEWEDVKTPFSHFTPTLIDLLHSDTEGKGRPNVMEVRSTTNLGLLWKSSIDHHHVNMPMRKYCSLCVARECVQNLNLMRNFLSYEHDF